MTFDPSKVWHTGNYRIQTDDWDSPAVACFAPDGTAIKAASMQELEEKVKTWTEE
jgi:hypothetical protein